MNGFKGVFKYENYDNKFWNWVCSHIQRFKRKGLRGESKMRA